MKSLFSLVLLSLCISFCVCQNPFVNMVSIDLGPQCEHNATMCPQYNSKHNTYCCAYIQCPSSSPSESFCKNTNTSTDYIVNANTGEICQVLCSATFIEKTAAFVLGVVGLVMYL